ncbi:uncharacterized protein STEHIDRAFT_27701, partial [Stereum hirsutum FP-91666 SS1]|uniref:uncharacterized protein n=1 Tax=Stereum hirsutum (strain FP-91666) TaxID=721885 RepID=UPI000440A94B
YVAASLLSTAVLMQWQAMKVADVRRKAGVEYPRMYADSEAEKDSLNARIFNCTQRAHQNTIENFPIILTTTLVTASKYPTIAAAACGAVSILRVVYTISYGSGDPEKACFIFCSLPSSTLI